MLLIFGIDFHKNYVKKIMNEFDEKIRICQEEKGKILNKALVNKYKKR